MIYWIGFVIYVLLVIWHHTINKFSVSYCGLQRQYLNNRLECGHAEALFRMEDYLKWSSKQDVIHFFQDLPDLKQYADERDLDLEDEDEDNEDDDEDQRAIMLFDDVDTSAAESDIYQALKEYSEYIEELSDAEKLVFNDELAYKYHIRIK